MILWCTLDSAVMFTYVESGTNTIVPTNDTEIMLPSVTMVADHSFVLVTNGIHEQNAGVHTVKNGKNICLSLVLRRL